MRRACLAFDTVILMTLLAAASAALAAGRGVGGTADPATGHPWEGASRFERLRVAVDDGAVPTVGFVSGVAIDRTWAIGLGVEYDRYDEANAFPLFLHLRVPPRGGEIGHLVFIEAGYCLLWIDGTPGTAGSGPFARGGMGRRIGRLFDSDVYASLSFRVQASEVYADRTGSDGPALTRFAAAVEFGL